MSSREGEPMTFTNPALALEGRTLNGGWVVGPLNVRGPDDTGGHFSASYPVSTADGRLGFLKVLDFAQSLSSPDPLQAIAVQTADFQLERDLCIACGNKRLSKVVIALDHGVLLMPEFGPLGAAHYIIFEHATRDVRKALSQAPHIDNVIRLEYLHDVAVGLRQLHSSGVAHQDLKPSNFLTFDDSPGHRPVGKLADLGRAYQRDVPSRIDHLVLPGDSNYAPPEQQYRYSYADEDTRRFAADLYQLGSLACFFFTRATMNAYLSRHLEPAHHWTSFGDGYEQALPYVEVAFERALGDIRALAPASIADELADLIMTLCHPRADERVHPSVRRRKHAARYSLEPTIAKIDLMARREAIRMSA